MRHQWPPDLTRPAGGRLALIQPWEFGSLPRDWQAGLQHDVDEVWVPSAFIREMYLDAGVEPDRVHVVPNGVDLEAFRPEGPCAELPDCRAAAAVRGRDDLAQGHRPPARRRTRRPSPAATTCCS